MTGWQVRRWANNNVGFTGYVCSVWLCRLWPTVTETTARVWLHRSCSQVDLQVFCRVVPQQVFYNAQASTVQQLLFGVPQGTVLGPLLYVLYTAKLKSRDYSARSVCVSTSTPTTARYIHKYHGRWGSTCCSEIHSVCHSHQWLDVSQQAETQSDKNGGPMAWIQSSTEHDQHHWHSASVNNV